MLSCVHGDLGSVPVTFTRGQAAVGVVAVSGGYPGAYKKGMEITGKVEIESETYLYQFFHNEWTWLDLMTNLPKSYFNIEEKKLTQE